MSYSFKKGDKVNIVDRWIGEKQNSLGEMDKYLGRIVEVSYTGSVTHFRIVEDEGSWAWFSEMVDWGWIERQKSPIRKIEIRR